MILRKVTAEHYYDVTPRLENAPGDIWSGLPLHGLLGVENLPGIVITPACDLAQGKVETITYLPIIPFRAFFSLTAALPDIERAVDGQLAAAGLNGLVSWPSAYTLPTVAMLDAADSLFRERASLTLIGKKESETIRRAQAGLRLIRSIITPGLFEANLSDLQLLFGDKEWNKQYVNRMVTNAFRADLHFLPSDRQQSSWSGVSSHSLVLFRCPMTAPIDIFAAAQDLSLSDWGGWCEQMADNVPMARRFAVCRPMKRVTLKPQFVSDLLTRFVSLYVRLGSPDFTLETVDNICKEINLGP